MAVLAVLAGKFLGIALFLSGWVIKLLLLLILLILVGPKLRKPRN
jgi:hypothetical protein